ncbi:unnamed protein product [marine sediment metagenome]|uniref:Uncharacterized protein n=1 Tax=marine sediment metagenome TaxID=412755 RepID=X1KIL2_9ZZZZ
MGPVQRTIWNCDRDLEGRKNVCLYRCKNNQSSRASLLNEETEFTKHWFLIISKESTQGFVTVLPISSQGYQITQNGGEQINDGDVVDSPDSTKSFPFTKPTFILCNKPCRIPIEDFDGEEDYGRLKKEIYLDNILYQMKVNFMPK